MSDPVSTEGCFDEVIDRRRVPALKFHPMVLGPDGEDLFPAGVADMDFRVAQPIVDALAARLDHGIFGYETVPDGLMPALVGWMERRHRWQINPEHVLRAPNVLNALAISASLFTEPGDGVIVQPPVFFDFFDILRENHRQCVSNPLLLADGRYQMDFDDLERKAALPRTRMIFLCNPHNPVGRVWTREELTTLGDICLRHNVIVVADEMHGDLVFPGHRHTPFAALGPAYADICITCLSPAKTFNIASCCSAFTVITNDQMRKAFQTENSRLTVNKNNAFANVAMEAAFRHGEPWLQEVISYLDGNVALVRERLRHMDGVDLIEPEGTFLAWLDLRGLDLRGLGLDPVALNAFLRQRAGWAVTRGVAFGDEGAGFARLNIACPRARLDQALGRLELAVKDLLAGR